MTPAHLLPGVTQAKRFVWLTALAAVVLCARTASALEMFAPPTSESTRTLVSIVAADIDSDGDLDVVASDTELELHVWINDGSGHFTRRDPMRPGTWQELPPLPGLDTHSTRSNAFTTPSSPSFVTGSRPLFWTLSASPTSLRRLAHRLPQIDRGSRTPRAPPAAPFRA
jgi:hypothetical protein